MSFEDFIHNQVHRFYWIDDYNCATTVLKTLSNLYEIELSNQVLWAAKGMHGAGKYGAQCGLVEGSLMFIGIYGTLKKLDNPLIVEACFKFAKAFEAHLGDLKCSNLRKGGFQETDPAHLCEELTNQALLFTIHCINDLLP